MITLFERTDCPFCWKVRIALAEMGVEYRIEATRLGEKHPEVARLSPTGTVPVLVDGDTAIWESAVILEYLDSRYGPGRLFPGTPTVLIACTAGHRDTGVFEASRYGIDRPKEIVPIWKKEVGPKGKEWVEGSYIPKAGE